MPRAQITREAEFLQSPSRDATPWYAIVYALPGSVVYLDPQPVMSGGMVQVQTTGAGNFQMNAVDTADYITRAEVVKRNLSTQGKTVQLPGQTMISSQRRNVAVAPQRTFWVDPSALRVIDEPKPPSLLWAVAANVAAVSIGSAFTGLAVKR